MPTAHYTSPFPSLDLTLDEKEQLQNTAHELVDEIRQLYENFLWKESATLNPAHWSLLRERDDVRVFQDHRPAAQEDLHRLLTVGMVNGTLHDAMFGELNHITDAMRIKTAYVKNTVLDCAVLETILEPTEENPFQSMTVRWFVKGIPVYVRALSKHLDNVYLEATGMRFLSNGEPVGFHLMHSIMSPKTPLLPNYDRSNISICSFWRQVSAQSVHVFRNCIGHISMSKLVAPVAHKSVADALISVHRVLDCAQLKKLTCLVQRITTAPHEATGLTQADGCSVCGAQIQCARRGVKSTCAICNRITCSRCRVKRRIFMVSLDRQLLDIKMRFCTPCLSSSTRMDGFEVAQSELQAMKAQTIRFMTRTETSASSSNASN